MDITFLGHSSFRLKGKTGSVITDPFDPAMLGLKYPSQEAEIVTVSHQHQDHNHVELVKNTMRVIDGPGEYEIAGISIVGLPTFHDDQKGIERGKNTVFVFEIDDLRLAHLGDLGHTLSAETIEEIGAIDILMLPVGGKFSLDAQTAVKVVQSIEPSIIIPMHYKMDGMSEMFNELTGVQDFITAAGVPSETLEKLSIKKGDIGEEQKIVVLERK